MHFKNLLQQSIAAKNTNLIESVQRRAARWIKSYFDPLTIQWTKSSDECLRELEWPSLGQRRNYGCVTMLYAILNKLTPIKFSDYFQINDLLTRSHPLTIRCLPSSINAFCHSFFVNSIFIWNLIPFDVLATSVNHFKLKLKLFVCF